MNKLDYRQFPERGDQREQSLFVLRYAVRAPSTHNSQPWLFRLEDDRIKVYADKSRKLPEGDKEGRDLYISLGACIEHLVTALRYFSMFERIELGELSNIDAPVAEIFIHQSGTRSVPLLPLIEAIENRFNARGPFLPKIISDDVFLEIERMAKEESVSFNLLRDRSDMGEFARLTARGMREAHAKKPFREEIASWMINNYSNRKDGIPGYTMLAPGILSLILPTIIGTFNMGKMLAKLNTKSILSSSAVGILSSKHDDPHDWLSVGRMFQRISLLLNTRGIRTSVFVASVEMPEIRQELKARFTPESLPQFTFAIGYPKITLRQSPRFSPEERMI